MSWLLAISSFSLSILWEIDLALVRKTLRSESVSVVVLLGFLWEQQTFRKWHIFKCKPGGAGLPLWGPCITSCCGDTDPKQMLVAPLSVVDLISTKEPNQTTPLLLNSLHAILNIFKNVTLIFWAVYLKKYVCVATNVTVSVFQWWWFCRHYNIQRFKLWFTPTQSTQVCFFQANNRNWNCTNLMDLKTIKYPKGTFEIFHCFWQRNSLKNKENPTKNWSDGSDQTKGSASDRKERGQKKVEFSSYYSLSAIIEDENKEREKRWVTKCSVPSETMAASTGQNFFKPSLKKKLKISRLWFHYRYHSWIHFLLGPLISSHWLRFESCHHC